jgi:hypothetical protein
MEIYKHIFLHEHAIAEQYTSPQSGGGRTNIPERDRVAYIAINHL